jgi:O-antigen/teichoic acid export membrane protein
MMLREHLRQLAFANLHLQLALLLDVSVAVAQLGGLAALWLAASLNAASAFVVSAVAAALGAVLWGTMSRVPVAFSADQIAPNFKRNWTLGRWLAGARVLSVLSIQAYPWMLAVFRGTGSAGYLAACQGTVGFTNVLLLAGGNLMYPITAHSRARSGPRETVVVGLRGSILYGVLFAPLLAILVGFGAEIVVTLYGTLYAGAGSVVRVLALSQLVLCVLIPLESALVALERRRVILVGHGAGFAATVILGAILTATWGPLGGAYGLLLYYASVATVFFWAVARTWLAQGHE